MTNKPNFKACQYYDKISGICRLAASLPSSVTAAYQSTAIQCCYMQPISTYDCPNPEINKQATEIYEDEELFEEEPEQTTQDKIHNLRYTNSDSGVIDAVIEILDGLRKEIVLLKEEIRQDSIQTLKSLEDRVKHVEKILSSEKAPGILFPTEEAARPSPVHRKSKASERDIINTNPDQAEREMAKEATSLELNEGIFKDYFHQGLDEFEIDLDDMDLGDD